MITKSSPIKLSAITLGILAITALPARAGKLGAGFFTIFLECNNDGLSQLLSPHSPLNSWQYTVDATADNTDGFLYDIRGIATVQTESAVYVAISGNTPIGGTGYDRNIDPVNYGDLFFSAGNGTFEENMQAGNLYGIHFSGSSESGATELGVYKNVAAKGVGMNNFGHRTYGNYANTVDSNVGNFFGDLDVNNAYLNNENTGYNTIAGGVKVENDGFEMLNLSQLAAAGFDDRILTGTETFGFKFNIDALVEPPPAPLPKTVEGLRGIAGEIGFDWDAQTWEAEIAVLDENIETLQGQADEHQVEADAQQTEADAQQAEADRQQQLQQEAEAESRRIQKQEINPRNRENNDTVKNNPGGAGNHAAKQLRWQRDKIEANIQDAEDAIAQNPGQITAKEQEIRQKQNEIDALPADEELTSDTLDKQQQDLQKVSSFVGELEAKKANWERFKTENNWENLTPEAQKALEDANPTLVWIETRVDGSLGKDAQDLAFQSDRVREIEQNIQTEQASLIAARNQKAQQLQNQIVQLQGNITDLQTQFDTANNELPGMRTELEKFNQNQQPLLDRLNTLLDDAKTRLGELEAKTNPTLQEQNELSFYQREVQALERQIQTVETKELAEVYDNVYSDFNKLRPGARTDESPILDENGNPKTYATDVEVTQYNERGRKIGTEIVPAGTVMSVGSEYRRVEAEIAVQKGLKAEENTKATIAQNAKQAAETAKQDALNAKKVALKNQENALTAKASEIDKKNTLLLEVESQIAVARDEAIALEKAAHMQEILEIAEAANAKEQALEERFGVRQTAEGGIPTTEAEAQDVPEPASFFGLVALGLGLAGRQFRKVRR
ncbi:MAG: PEP-CTERM sorting domain-containing protein [Cyanobacteria bacterium SBLK]|nr:PEP-CTERM sorting domain-containing protein [Cyanobacteria bacterium SBLK]